MPELLSANGITKKFGQNRVLHDVSFSIHSGEILCIVGENGAGKSTLIKILAGALKPSEGIMTIGGKTYQSLRPKESMDLGICTIYQDIELIDYITVADNIFLGREETVGYGVVDTKKQLKMARDIMDRLHISINEESLVCDLTVSEKQMLQIVKALHKDAKILIMDEPTSSLGIEETKALLEIIDSLKRDGIGIIYISHYLEEVFSIGDTILVLKDGEHVGTYNREDVSEKMIIEKMVGRSADMFYQKEQVELKDSFFEVKNFNWGDRVQDVSFSVRQGEIFGLGGMVGAGRSELACLIFGAETRDGGELYLGSEKLHVNSPTEAIENGIAFITEDRKKYALLVDRSVRENITLIVNEKSSSFVVNRNKEEKDALNMIGSLHIALSNQEMIAGNLSGGNQQKTIIGRWLLSQCKVYIFDEPTKGVDIGSKEEIYKEIVELAKLGNYIILISSDMPELLSLSDRIGVMYEGKLTHILDRGIEEEELLKYFLGIDHGTID